MIVFDDVATVEVKGDTTLERINFQDGVAIYRVRALEPKIMIRDFRRSAEANMRELSSLNGPAEIKIHQLNNGSMLVDLHETSQRSKKFMLSIDNCVSEFVPRHETVFDHFDFRTDDNSLVYVAVYKLIKTRRAHQEWSFLSV